ncbi:hypothetical protein [Microcystis phage MJing1]|nr:hypothetical protein [Microcystis phage MJing1]
MPKAPKSEAQAIAEALRGGTWNTTTLRRAAELIERADVVTRARDEAEDKLAALRSMFIRLRERLKQTQISNVEAHDAAIAAAARCAREHDTQPRVSAKDDPLAAANQQGYLTARDQIAEAILKLKAKSIEEVMK